MSIDGDEIGGVVTGPNGPEAGVWVIAEATELPTKYAKIDVTEAAGQTGAAATQVLGAAGELSQQSEMLKSKVEFFLAEIRAA